MKAAMKPKPRKTLTVRDGLHSKFKKVVSDKGMKLQAATDSVIEQWLEKGN